MAIIKVKDLQEALKLIKQVLAMLDKIYHAVTEENSKKRDFNDLS